MRNTVINGVNKAFRLIGDLAVDVTFTLKTASGFDYSSGTATLSAPQVLTVKAVVTKKVKKGTGTIVCKLLMKSQDLANAKIESLDVIDTVVIDGQTYKVVLPEGDRGYDNGYTTIIEAVQEVA